MSEKKISAPAMTQTAAKVIQLFDRGGGDSGRSGRTAEVPLTVAPAPASGGGSGGGADNRVSKLDLTGRPKLIMLCGPGRTGKSTVARWMIENALRKSGELALVTLDAERPTLPLYFPECMRPPSASEVGEFFDQLLSALCAQPVTTVLDFYADGTLAFALREHGGAWFLNLLEKAGISPVLLYTFSPRVSDLTVASIHLELGFAPETTALLLNCGTVTGGRNVDRAFDDLRAHSVFRRLIESEAEVVTVPRLFGAEKVESRWPLSFEAAEREDSGLDVIERQRVYGWRRQMDKAFSVIGTWLA